MILDPDILRNGYHHLDDLGIGISDMAGYPVTGTITARTIVIQRLIVQIWRVSAS